MIEIIKKIKQREAALNQALEDGDFPQAIALCLQCKKAIPLAQKFPALRSLNTVVQSSYEAIQRKLDNSLADVTRSFDPVKYERVLRGYRLLGSTHRVLEKLQRHFIETIHSNAENSVYAHALMSPENAAQAEVIKELKFNEQCSKVQEEHFLSCLLVILEYACELMKTHYQMSDWHRAYEEYVLSCEEHERESERVACLR